MPSTGVYALPYQALTDPPNGAVLGQALAEAVEAELVRVDDALTLVGNSAGINVAGAVDSTTSATYVNLAAPSSAVFTKLRPAAETSLRIEMHGGWFTTLATTTAWFGVLVNGVDHDVDSIGTNLVAGVALRFGGTVYVSGLAAGVHTVQARWKRTAGTGVPSRIAESRLSISVTEVAA